ncbi:MAG: hypothetical protein KDA85_18820 [Planctomycetaceae bacterium]|nr:hypothetical protein [Planctomycetaceae bacterium]
MNGRRFIVKLVALNIVIVMCCVTTSTTSAIVIVLKSPRNLPFSLSTSRDAHNRLVLALQDDGCRYLRGVSVNAISTLSYQGQTEGLNRQLQSLAGCPGTTVVVSFEKMEESCDWQITHDCRTMELCATINLDSRSIDLEELKIPMSTLPALKP